MVRWRSEWTHYTNLLSEMKRNLEKRDANGLLYMQSPGEKQTHSQEKIRPSSHSWSWGGEYYLQVVISATGDKDT
ncbi:hypothetical protein FKM82_023394 [Ascaphus truei]